MQVEKRYYTTEGLWGNKLSSANLINRWTKNFFSSRMSLGVEVTLHQKCDPVSWS
jgi:hypothetical protein